MVRIFKVFFRLALLACLFHSIFSTAEMVPVRYREGVTHGFLVLRTTEGQSIADGDSTQVTKGQRVITHLRFRFRDGSIYEETTVFSQQGAFRLLRDHVIQKGPSFKQPLESTIDTASGRVTVRYTEDGKEKIVTQRLELRPDVANGIVFTLLKNFSRGATKTTLSYVATTPKPHLVELEIASQGEDPFSIGSYSHKAIHYVIKVKIGGVAGVIAPIVGKQPPDTMHGWSGMEPQLSSNRKALYTATDPFGEWNLPRRLHGLVQHPNKDSRPVDID